jgi:hypothetical protein
MSERYPEPDVKDDWEPGIDSPSRTRIFEVTWEDAAALTGAWDELDAVLSDEGRKSVRVHSVGYVLADDERSLILARSVHGSRVGGVAIIPHSAIIERRRLR